jgi:hypothetical protein
MTKVELIARLAVTICNGQLSQIKIWRYDSDPANSEFNLDNLINYAVYTAAEIVKAAETHSGGIL